MKELYREIKELLEKGEKAVMVTITASSGSTPRSAGSKMLVKQDGSIRGSIGGGAVEYQAIREALKAMEMEDSFQKEFSLTRGQAADIGMVCGGDVNLYFQQITGKGRGQEQVWEEILDALDGGKESWLVTDLTDEADWKMKVYRKPFRSIWGEEGGEEKAGLCREEGKVYFREPLVRNGRVYIFGGGHVARELVPVLSHLGFRCVVMDDREDFANKAMFPDAEKTVAGDLEHISDYVKIENCDYVCIMTRGHQYDYYVQKQVMPCRPCYIGVMGSRNKIKVVSEKLMADGFAKEEVERCHMPIGMEIAAETPEEIAVSIAGELIAVRAKRLGRRKSCS